MTVRDIMNKNVVTVTQETDVVAVSELMAKEDVGCIPVVADGRVEGMLTDRDIVLRCVAKGRDPMLCTVGEIMTRSAAYVYADQTVEDAANMMGAEQVRRLPVLDKGSLAGMVTLSDIAKKHQQDVEVAEALAEITTPYRLFS